MEINAEGRLINSATVNEDMEPGAETEIIIRVRDFEVIKCLRAPMVPPSLWHYTTREGLLGILNERVVWFTSIHYMNDARELAYARDLLFTLLATFANGPDELRTQLVSAVGAVLRTVPHHPFAFSLSEVPDDLGQWRAYGTRGAYALEFDSAKLGALGGDLSLMLVQCNYDLTVQQKWISACLEHGIDRARELAENDASRKHAIGVGAQIVIVLFMMIAPALKDPAFRAESEWRMVTPLHPEHALYVRYRAGRSAIVPFIPMGFDKEFPLIGVDIGPNPHPDLDERALRGLLAEKGLGSAQVRRSKIPYRGW